MLPSFFSAEILPREEKGNELYCLCFEREGGEGGGGKKVHKNRVFLRGISRIFRGWVLLPPHPTCVSQEKSPYFINIWPNLCGNGGINGIRQPKRKQIPLKTGKYIKNVLPSWNPKSDILTHQDEISEASLSLLWTLFYVGGGMGWKMFEFAMRVWNNALNQPLQKTENLFWAVNIWVRV